MSYCVLQKLIQVTLGGWPSQKSDNDLDVCAYYNARHELSVQKGLVLKDNRIVVPTSVFLINHGRRLVLTCLSYKGSITFYS